MSARARADRSPRVGLYSDPPARVGQHDAVLRDLLDDCPILERVTLDVLAPIHVDQPILRVGRPHEHLDLERGVCLRRGDLGRRRRGTREIPPTTLPRWNWRE